MIVDCPRTIQRFETIAPSAASIDRSGGSTNLATKSKAPLPSWLDGSACALGCNRLAFNRSVYCAIELIKSITHSPFTDQHLQLGSSNSKFQTQKSQVRQCLSVRIKLASRPRHLPHEPIYQIPFNFFHSLLLSHFPAPSSPWKGSEPIALFQVALERQVFDSIAPPSFLNRSSIFSLFHLIFYRTYRSVDQVR